MCICNGGCSKCRSSHSRISPWTPKTLEEKIKETEENLAFLKKELRDKLKVERLRANALKKLSEEEKQALGL